MTEEERERAAALFVSNEGEIRSFPESAEGADHWKPPPPGWWQWRPFLPDAVTAGVLRLIDERDEARAERDEALTRAARTEWELEALQRRMEASGQ